MTVEVTGPAEFQSPMMNSMVKRKGEVTDNITKNSKLKINFLFYPQKFLNLFLIE